MSDLFICRYQKKPLMLPYTYRGFINEDDVFQIVDGRIKSTGKIPSFESLKNAVIALAKRRKNGRLYGK